MLSSLVPWLLRRLKTKYTSKYNIDRVLLSMVGLFRLERDGRRIEYVGKSGLKVFWHLRNRPAELVNPECVVASHVAPDLVPSLTNPTDLTAMLEHQSTTRTFQRVVKMSMVEK